VPIRLTATMNVPLAIPLPRMTVSHRGSVSKLGGRLRADGGRVDEDVGAGEGVARASSGNHWSQQWEANWAPSIAADGHLLGWPGSK